MDPIQLEPVFQVLAQLHAASTSRQLFDHHGLHTLTIPPHQQTTKQQQQIVTFSNSRTTQPQTLQEDSKWRSVLEQLPHGPERFSS